MLPRSFRASVFFLAIVTLINLIAQAQVPDPVMAAEAPVPGAGHTTLEPAAKRSTRRMGR